MWDEEGVLVSHVGLLVRAGTVDGAAVKIGGIGSVKTHPRGEGRGYASAGLRLAAAALNDDHRVAFSLLVCRDHLLPFYNRLGWLSFSGRLFVEQPAAAPRSRSTARWCCRGCARPPHRTGTIDLNGPPW